MIIEAIAKDIDEILIIEEKLFSSPWSRENFNIELHKEISLFYVLKIDFTVVGYIVAYNLGIEAEIANIAVSTKFQGKGYASQLLDVVFLQLENKTDIFLEVSTKNSVAIFLYKKFGFKEVAIRKNYYGIGNDAMVMKLIISRGV